jgi:acetyl esterase/lipase
MSTPEVDTSKKIAAMGPVFNPEILVQTRELYTPLVIPLGDLKVSVDLPYGDDDRQRVDLYRPAHFEQPATAVVHFTGGGFVAGDKRIDATFFANIGGHFARHGMLGVVANHRLAPVHPWPAARDDVGRVVSYIRANVTNVDGGPIRIVLWGISAGATHVAAYLFDRAARGDDTDGVVGAILTSGFYRVPSQAPPNVKAYFGSDEALYEDRSPMSHANAGNVPVLLTVSEHDPAMFGAQTFELAAALTRRSGKCAQLVWLAGHNHASTAFSVGTADDALGPLMLDFIRTLR